MENNESKPTGQRSGVFARLELGKHGSLEFKTRQDLREWLVNEGFFWHRLSSVPVNTGMKPGIRLPRIPTFGRIFDEAIHLLDSISELAPETEQRAVLNEIETRLIHAMNQEGLVLGNSPGGALIRELATSQPVAAVAAVARLSGIASTSSDAQIVEGLIRAYAMTSRWPESAAKASESYEEVKSRLEQTFGLQQQSLEVIKSDFGIKAAEMTSAALATQRESEAFLKTTEAKFELAFATVNEQLENLRNKYDAQMALRAPVQYWSEKAKRHRRSSWICGAVVLVYFIGALIGLWEIMKLWAAPEEIATKVVEKRLFPQLPNYSVAFILLVAFVAFWFGRILVRVLLSQVHLFLDAEQRVVMANTYLALVGEGSLTVEASRESILRALFRPVSTGIVRDDAVPPTPFGTILPKP